jgi:hypothetical protein
VLSILQGIRTSDPPGRACATCPSPREKNSNEMNISLFHHCAMTPCFPLRHENNTASSSAGSMGTPRLAAPPPPKGSIYINWWQNLRSEKVASPPDACSISARWRQQHHPAAGSIFACRWATGASPPSAGSITIRRRQHCRPLSPAANTTHRLQQHPLLPVATRDAAGSITDITCSTTYSTAAPAT